MSDDLVRRLRHDEKAFGDEICGEAADEIDRLRAREARLREALERIADTDPDAGTQWFHEVARAALAEQAQT